MDTPEQFSFDYFVSRSGVSADIATEVSDALEGAGFRVKTQDYDFGRGGDFVGDIHDALMQARHLYILHTDQYDRNYWTRKEFTNFMAAASESPGARRICVLRCDQSTPRGILANTVYGDISTETDRETRRKIILEVARGDARAKRRDPLLFGGSIPPLNVSFIGREAIMAEVKHHFEAAAAAAELRAVALVGMGGVGKTSTARVLVERLGPDYAGVWWITAESRTSVLAGLAAIAERLDPQAVVESDVKKSAQAALRHFARSERPYLLVFDNLDDQMLFDECVPARGAHLLVTTRRTDWFGRAREIRLDVMDAEEAVFFLQARAGRRDELGARTLARAVGYLPLALDHAGAYAKHTMMSFEAYAKRADALVSKAPKGAPYPMSLDATFSLAIDGAVREAGDAEICMRVFAFVASNAIPVALCDGFVDEDACGAAMAALAGVSLIHPETLTDNSPGVSVHRLVQAVMRTRIAPQDVRQTLELLAVRLMSLFPENSYDRVAEWPICASLLPHALCLCEHAKAAGMRSESLIVVSSRAAEYLHSRFSYDMAISLYRESLDAARVCCGGSHPETVRLSTKLANVLRSLGRVGEAETLLRQALSSEAVDWADRAHIMTSLAALLHETDRLEETESLLRHAIVTSETRLGRDHPDVALRLNNLARVRQDRGDAIEAQALFREAIASGEARLGRTHPLVADRLNNLAKLLQDLEKVQEAEALYREAIASGEAALDPLSPALAIRRQNLANLLRDSNRYHDAEALYRLAVGALNEALPATHPILARVKYNLATVLRMLGRADEALALAQSAAAAHSAALGEAHPWTMQSSDLAKTITAQRQARG